MILTGPEIGREVRAGRIHISGFDPERLEPNSYGFRLGSTVIRYRSDELDAFTVPEHRSEEIGEDGMVLEPGRFYLGSTVEAMGSPHYAATLYACRSVSTAGMWIQFSAPLGHSGAIFPWTLEIQVAHPIRVYPGMDIGKIAFWAMQGAPTLYDGKYSGSASVVASRLAMEHREAAPASSYRKETDRP